MAFLIPAEGPAEYVPLLAELVPDAVRRSCSRVDWPFLSLLCQYLGVPVASPGREEFPVTSVWLYATGSDKWRLTVRDDARGSAGDPNRRALVLAGLGRSLAVNDGSWLHSNLRGPAVLWHEDERWPF